MWSPTDSLRLATHSLLRATLQECLPDHNPHHLLVPVEATEPPRQVTNRRRAEGVQ